jgi:hypothetical protein
LPKAKVASDPVVGRIVDSGREIHSRIVGGRKPSMRFPLRSLSNVRCDPNGIGNIYRTHTGKFFP